MADGVDAAVDSMEATTGKAMLDGAAAEPHPLQLPVRDDAVLLLGKLRDQGVDITRRQKPMHVMGK